MYRVRQFAELAGVTVRTLHHYDRLGLLKCRRSESGYRLYGDRDLERLEQIVALKFIGVPLSQIRALLDREGLPLPEALRRQRRALEEKQRLLERAIGAIRKAESSLGAGQCADSALLKQIIEVIEMQDNQDWMEKYSNDAAKAKIAARRQLWSPELQERVSKQWMDLLAEVEAALAEDPAGPHAQELARRWTELVEGFTGGDPDVTESVKNVWADRANWPQEFQRQAAPFRVTRQMWEFISKALATRKA